MATRFFRTKSKTPEQLMQELEERLKLNRGSGVLFAEDTGYQPRSVLPGYRMTADPTGFQASVAPRDSLLPDRPRRAEIPQFDQPVFDESIFEKSTAPISLSERPTVKEFLTSFTQSLYAPRNQSIDYLDRLYQITGTPYGIASLRDGRILLNTGQAVTSEQAVPIATLRDGRVLFSDGSARALSRSLATQLGGVAGLSQGLFGRQQLVTQAFGNYNPSLYGKYGGTRNIGVDFRTKDLDQPIIFPVSAEIVSVTPDDGKNPYGNSVLVRLPSGEMLRLSHLAQLPPVKAGQIVAPGELTLIPGATGNATAEHLDVEYYNTKGKLDNPANFSGFTEPMQYVRDVERAAQASTPPRLQSPQQQQMQRMVEDELPSDPLLGITEPLARTIATELRPGSTTRQTIAKPITETGSALNAPELGLGETIAYGPEAGKQARVEELKAGSYAYNPYRQLAGNLVERVGDTLGIPEGVLSEAIAGNATKRTGIALADEIGSVQPDQVPGIRQNIADIATDVAGKAGAGIERLKQGIAGAIAGIRPSPSISDLGTRKVVGGEAGQAPASFGSVTKIGRTNDTTDPFFRTPQAQALSRYLTPGAKEAGAVVPQAFTEEFYHDPSRIQSVFGGSVYYTPAMQRYEAYQERQHQLAMEAARQAYEQELRSQLRSRGLDEGQIRNFIASGSIYDSQTKTSYTPERNFSSSVNASYAPPQRNFSSSVNASSNRPTPSRSHNASSNRPTPSRSGNASYAPPQKNSSSSVNASYAQPTPSRPGFASYRPPPPPPKNEPKKQNIFNKAAKVISNIFRRRK